MTFCMPNYPKKDQKCKDEWENILTIWNIISQGRNEEMCSRVKSSEKLLPRKNYIAPNEVGQLKVVSQYLKSRKICTLWQESFEKCWFLSLESMNFILHNIFPFFEQCALTRATMRVRFWSKNLHTYPSGKISSCWRKYLAPSIFLKLHKSFLYIYDIFLNPLHMLR